MQRLLLLVLSCTLALTAEKVRILRDEFGVPHIFASTPAGAAYRLRLRAGRGSPRRDDAQLPQSRRHHVRSVRRKLVPARLPAAHVAAPPGGRGALQRAQPANARCHRSLPGRRQAIHGGASRAGSRVGAEARAVAGGRARPFHDLGLARGGGRRRSAARRHRARSRSPTTARTNGSSRPGARPCMRPSR